MNKLVGRMIVSLLAGVVVLGAGCAGLDPQRDDATAELAAASGPGQTQTRRFITFVTYYDDAAHSNVVGAATFNGCHDDAPAMESWGAQTEFHTIESEPCG